jgi:hypothetical protein
MAKWKWPPFGALIPFLTLASVFLAYGLIANAERLDSSYEHQSKVQADAYGNGARIRIQRDCVRLVAEERDKCARVIVDTAREAQHNQYDLIAQRSTANWTRHMGIAAIFGTAFGIIGVGLVLATFYQNKRSADAAERDLRPVLLFHGVPEIEESHGRSPRIWTVRFKLINEGRTPAVIMSAEQGHVLTSHQTNRPDLKDIPWRSAADVNRIISAGAPLILTVWCSEWGVTNKGGDLADAKDVITAFRVLYRSLGGGEERPFETRGGVHLAYRYPPGVAPGTVPIVLSGTSEIPEFRKTT